MVLRFSFGCPRFSLSVDYWEVQARSETLEDASLDKESILEQIIVKNPSILSDRWMLIGRQVKTMHGGSPDLMALNQDGSLIVIELKRNQTPREVVAQALDYASWAQGLASDEVASIYTRFSNGGSLGEDFQKRFELKLDED